MAHPISAMKIIKQVKLLIMFSVMLTSLASWGAYPINYEASFMTGAGGGEFSPYYISSLRHGRVTQRYNVQLEAMAWRPVDVNSRFSYGFGVDVIGGYASKVDYERFNPATGWYKHSIAPSALWLQQLYGEVKYRSLFLTAGMKEHESALLNQNLTSGDVIESGNSRPIPEIRAGFVDFQDIPFTDGWLQIQGEVAYGKFTDNGWNEKHYNYYNYHIVDGEWYNYKRCYFRTKPSKPFSVTLGMQAAGLFGGEEKIYRKGELTRTMNYPVKFKTFVKMLIPTQDGGEGFYTGEHIGSWDMKARYRLKSGAEIAGYFSWLWSDGSGIGKLNGWDGLWGVEYKAASRGVIDGAVIEYMDYTNQSGPIHFAPGDHDGVTIHDHASGADDYYNNTAHRSYANYGMAIGSPAFMSPIYNTNGYPAFMANVMRGIHLGVEGSITPDVDYRLKAGYRKAWGSAKVILPEPIHSTSVMVEAVWRVRNVKGLTVKGQLEVDRGSMPCDMTGAMVSVRYDGLFNL